VLRRWGCESGIVSVLGWLRSSRIEAGLAQRARIVLLAADGLANTDIATRVGVSRPTVTGWRQRYARCGIGGLSDQARSGRPRTVDHRKIVAATLKAPPKKLGVTHWSSRLLAQHLKIGDATVARAWPGVWSGAVAVRDLQILYRPRAGREGHRCRRALPRPAGERGGVVHR
jgi:transposase